MNPTPTIDDPQFAQEPRWAGVRQVATMSAPIVMSSVSYTILEFCDKLMVSRVGTDALAAVGAASIGSFTLATLFLGIVSCVSTFVSQSLGRERPEDCARYAWQGIYLAVPAAMLSALLWPLTPPLFGLMQHAPDVMALEITYFRIRLLGYFALAWATAVSSFFISVNRPSIPMYTAILATALNLLLNYLLIFGKFGFPEMGVAGAALATSITQIAHAAVLHLIFISRSFEARYGTRSQWRFDSHRTRELVRIGVPGGITMFLDIANWFIFTTFVVGPFGPAALAAHTIAISFMHVSFMPAVAVHQAIAPIVGEWISRGNVQRAKARTYTAIRLIMGYMGSVGILFGVFGGVLIARFFSDDPVVISLGHKMLMLAALFQAFDAINIICIGALRGAGDTRWMMFATFVMAYLFFLPLSLVFAFVLGGGAFGGWVAASMYIIVLSGLLFHRFYGEKWRDINIFLDEAPTPAPEPAAVAK